MPGEGGRGWEAQGGISADAAAPPLVNVLGAFVMGPVGKLTPRRGETLAVLRRLAAERGGAVHYSEVAAAMGISAWTAYGLLRELERAGLAARSYATGTDIPQGARRGGRSRILFAPSGIVLVPVELAERLRRAVERFSAVADEGVAARLYLAGGREGGGGGG